MALSQIELARVKRALAFLHAETQAAAAHPSQTRPGISNFRTQCGDLREPSSLAWSAAGTT